MPVLVGTEALGVGVFADAPVTKGSHVHLTAKQSDHLNHSCRPNAQVVDGGVRLACLDFS